MTGGDMPRCPHCGSVFQEHTCHLLPPWIALMAARSRRRRAAIVDLPGGVLSGPDRRRPTETNLSQAVDPTGNPS